MGPPGGLSAMCGGSSGRDESISRQRAKTVEHGLLRATIAIGPPQEGICLFDLVEVAAYRKIKAFTTNAVRLVANSAL